MPTPSDYPRTLVEQARALLALDAVGRPRQANLRRAVSSAYYGLFHRLCIDATAEIVGAAKTKRATSRFLVRKFDHGRMKAVCNDFAPEPKEGKPEREPQLPEVLRVALDPPVLDARLRRVCRSFVKLQDERHLADYDLSRDLIRTDAEKLVDQAAAALGDWEQIRSGDQARLFKLCLLVGTAARG